jgi:CheY-like chemotaxis protein
LPGDVLEGEANARYLDELLECAPLVAQALAQLCIWAGQLTPFAYRDRPASFMHRRDMHDGATILLAEDREDDIILVRKAFERGHIANPLFIVRDGEEAINYLTGVFPFSDRVRFPIPSLLLLDLKMPRVDGFAVLRWLKTEPSLMSLRVVVLTSSEDIRDVSKAYQLGANSFLVKPLDFHNTVAMVETITDYWLGMNRAARASPVTPLLENLRATETESEPR